MSGSPSSRREFLAAAGLAAGGAWLPGGGAAVAAQATTRVRRNIRDLAPNGPEVAQLRDAFRILEARPSNNVLGWLAQANIHRARCAHANWWFLPWHRGYLFYFERVIQAAIGDSTFALPYWDWSDPSTRTIPAPFWGQYLYRVIRGPGIGPSSQVPAEFVDRDAVIEPILQIPNFQTFGGSPSSSPVVRTAGGWLEGSPHNNVHNWVGGAMARPEWAAQDPIFWLHHANVDRLWSEWNRRHPGALPASAAWRNQPFSFYNTDGRPVSITPAQVLSTTALGYRYDDEPAAAPTLLAQARGAPIAPVPPSMRASAVPARPVLGPTPVTVTLRPASPEFHQRARPLIAPAAEAPAPSGHLRLAIEGLQPPDAPQVLVRVFLNLPTATAETPFTDPHYAGNFSFFHSSVHDAASHAAHAPYAQHLDVTAALRRLAEAGQYKPGDPIQVTLLAVPIAPDQRPATATQVPFRSVALEVVP